MSWASSTGVDITVRPEEIESAAASTPSEQSAQLAASRPAGCTATWPCSPAVSTTIPATPERQLILRFCAQAGKRSEGTDASSGSLSSRRASTMRDGLT